MTKMCKLWTVVAVLAVWGSIGAAQSTKNQSSASPQVRNSAPDEAMQTISRTQGFDEVAISPDGTKVSWVEPQKDKEGAETGASAIYVTDHANSGKPRRVTASVAGAFADEHGLAWSPDSKHLAFLSDTAKKGQLQLYVTDSAGGSARKLSSAKGLLATPKWSPDGKSIALLYTENATRAAGPLAAETAETGLIKDAFFEQRLAVLDPTGGKLRSITPEDTYIYEYDWAPDSKTLVLTAAKGNGDNNWWIAQLYTVNFSAKDMRPIYKPK
jgi:Tol biopolymer transport system component